MQVSSYLPSRKSRKSKKSHRKVKKVKKTKEAKEVKKMVQRANAKKIIRTYTNKTREAGIVHSRSLICVCMIMFEALNNAGRPALL